MDLSLSRVHCTTSRFLSICSSFQPILVNAISQECLKGIPLNLRLKLLDVTGQRSRSLWPHNLSFFLSFFLSFLVTSCASWITQWERTAAWPSRPQTSTGWCFCWCFSTQWPVPQSITDSQSGSQKCKVCWCVFFGPEPSHFVSDGIKKKTPLLPLFVSQSEPTRSCCCCSPSRCWWRCTRLACRSISWRCSTASIALWCAAASSRHCLWRWRSSRPSASPCSAASDCSGYSRWLGNWCQSSVTETPGVCQSLDLRVWSMLPLILLSPGTGLLCLTWSTRCSTPWKLSAPFCSCSSSSSSSSPCWACSCSEGNSTLTRLRWREVLLTPSLRLCSLASRWSPQFLKTFLLYVLSCLTCLGIS